MSELETNCLVLNRSYFPVGVCLVKEAFKLVCEGNATILNGNLEPFDYESWSNLEVEEGMESVGVVEKRIRVPRVIRLAHFNGVPKTVVRFSRPNVLMRDSFICQYCGKKKDSRELDLEHVLPKSRGGKTQWENIVASCRTCNQKKADKTPQEAGMSLMRQPYVPSWSQLQILLRKGKIRPEWEPFVAPLKERMQK